MTTSAITAHPDARPAQGSGRWREDALAALPPGDYRWHHFSQRGYLALAASCVVARVEKVRPKGWLLRLEAYVWDGAANGQPAEVDGTEARWFASSRAALAAAGKLLGAAPFCRRELAQAPAGETAVRLPRVESPIVQADLFT